MLVNNWQIWMIYISRQRRQLFFPRHDNNYSHIAGIGSFSTCGAFFKLITFRIFVSLHTTWVKIEDSSKIRYFFLLRKYKLVKRSENQPWWLNDVIKLYKSFFLKYIRNFCINLKLVINWIINNIVCACVCVCVFFFIFLSSPVESN